MMVQSAPAGEPHFVCTMIEHNNLCGQFARAFGNDEFEPLDPYEEMLFVAGHHDRGWDSFDAKPALDSDTGLPASVGGRSRASSVDTSRLSPDFNEARHLYSGLLSSMHSWGLYHERYGYSEFRVRPGVSRSVPSDGPESVAIHAMLDGELARQERLKAALAASPETAGWIAEKHLTQNYKQLQFFDTLALYFHLRHDSERREEIFVHVPKSAGEDASVTVTPQGDGVYRLSPFPFAGDRLEAACAGRYLKPIPPEERPDDLGAALAALPTVTQVHTLVAG